MEIKVILKRRVKKAVKEQLRPLINKMRQQAMSMPGYISGETLTNIEDPNDFIVISTWKDLQSWNDWFASEHRQEIQTQIDFLLFENTQYEIYSHE